MVRIRPVHLGIVGAVLLFAGSAWYQATITPPYRFVDEQAHAGYVLAIQDGTLPSIDTPIDADAGGVALRTRLATEPTRRQDVWVANNPPLTYVLAAVPAAITRSLGLPGGPLMGLRLLNLAAVAVAVFLSYLLGRDLAGGDRTVGLVTAGLVAALPHLGFVAALGFNDGVSLLATTGVLLALARICADGPTRSEVRGTIRGLGTWCAVAAGARPMALVVAVAAALVGLGVVWFRRSAPRPWSLAWIALPSTLAWGWFYALNLRRYGDPTGSSALLGKFGRQPTASFWSTLTLKGMWESALRTLTTRRLEMPLPGDPYGWYRGVLVVVLLGVIGALAIVIRSSRRDGHGGTAWAAVAVVSLVPMLLVAQHRASGGAPHPRYLLPMVPVVAATVALTTVRLLTRWAGAILVVALATIALRQTRASARWLAANPAGPPGSQLVTAYGNEVLRGAGLVAAGVGLALLLCSITLVDRAT